MPRAPLSPGLVPLPPGPHGYPNRSTRRRHTAPRCNIAQRTEPQQRTRRPALRSRKAVTAVAVGPFVPQTPSISELQARPNVRTQGRRFNVIPSRKARNIKDMGGVISNAPTRYRRVRIQGRSTPRSRESATRRPIGPLKSSSPRVKRPVSAESPSRRSFAVSTPASSRVSACPAPGFAGSRAQRCFVSCATTTSQPTRSSRPSSAC